MSLDPLRRAIDLAVENVRTGRGGPFGAVVVRDGAIVAEGTNLVTATYDPTAHAEVIAIRRACERLKQFDLRGCQIYASCEPCPMCLSAIYWARLDALYFAASQQDAAEAGFDDSFLYTEIPLPVSERSLPTRKVSSNEALLPFAEWRASSMKVPY